MSRSTMLYKATFDDGGKINEQTFFAGDDEHAVRVGIEIAARSNAKLKLHKIELVASRASDPAAPVAGRIASRASDPAAPVAGRIFRFGI